jgi:hypothetical protein
MTAFPQTLTILAASVPSFVLVAGIALLLLAARSATIKFCTKQWRPRAADALLPASLQQARAAALMRETATRAALGALILPYLWDLCWNRDASALPELPASARASPFADTERFYLFHRTPTETFLLCFVVAHWLVTALETATLRSMAATLADAGPRAAPAATGASVPPAPLAPRAAAGGSPDASHSPAAAPAASPARRARAMRKRLRLELRNAAISTACALASHAAVLGNEHGALSLMCCTGLFAEAVAGWQALLRLGHEHGVALGWEGRFHGGLPVRSLGPLRLGACGGNRCGFLAWSTAASLGGGCALRAVHGLLFSVLAARGGAGGPLAADGALAADGRRGAEAGRPSAAWTASVLLAFATHQAVVGVGAVEWWISAARCVAQAEAEAVDRGGEGARSVPRAAATALRLLWERPAADRPPPPRGGGSDEAQAGEGRGRGSEPGRGLRRRLLAQLAALQQRACEEAS